tara:strand:- start:227 stop:1123 length:897 start_codon:yes stop_codon:yes gene_type:complete
MITVNIKDGLGNQMFQFATAYALAKKNKTNVICDIRSLEEKIKNPPINYTVREFSLDIFKIYPSKLNFFDTLITFQINKKYTTRFFFSNILDRISPFNFLERSRKTNQKLIKTKSKILYLDGYWQSEVYFKDFREDILRIFNFDDLIYEKENIDLLKKINLSNDVCLNIRRTDHLNSDELNVISSKYYERSIDYFLRKNGDIRFFIFSDDIEWCRKKFKNTVRFKIIGHEYAGKKFKNYLYLMSKFKNFIIPNSTFAWWGAWLSNNKNKTVIVPKKWSGIDPENEIDTPLKEWIKIEN